MTSYYLVVYSIIGKLSISKESIDKYPIVVYTIDSEGDVKHHTTARIARKLLKSFLNMKGTF